MPTVSRSDATPSRQLSVPRSGTSSSAPSPSASGEISCTCHTLVRFSKPTPGIAMIATNPNASHGSMSARTITCHSNTTIATCTATNTTT